MSNGDQAYLEEARSELLTRYQGLISDDEFDRFKEAITTEPAGKDVRVNTLKTERSFLVDRFDEQGWEPEPIPWCPAGLVVKQPPRGFGNTIEHRLGFCYIQGRASWLPVLALDPHPGDRVLDVAAAPGGKASHIAQLMENSGMLVVNDEDSRRLNWLQTNFQRLGVRNAIATNEPGESFASIEPRFDAVLLDAPCTSEGQLATNPEGVLELWSENFIQEMADLQQKLLEASFSYLRPGGTLVYSTCSIAPEENEGTIDSLLRTHEHAELEQIDLHGINHVNGVTQWRDREYLSVLERTKRLYPHLANTEGFFLAKLTKTANN